MAVNRDNLISLPERRGTVRRIIRAWIEEAIDGRDVVDIDDLVTEAQADLRQDWDLLDALADEAIRDLVPPIARQVLGKERGMLPLGNGGFVSGDEMERRVAERLARWYEHVGETTHRSILQMNRTDLLFSAEHREVRAEGELRVARFERALAKGLKSSKQRVVERYSIEEIVSLWETANGKS